MLYFVLRATDEKSTIAKGAIRDVGRVLDFGYTFCDGVSKLIPFKPGKPVSIAEAIEEEPLLKERLLALDPADSDGDGHAAPSRKAS